uniref:THAP-type domain-containing protein n=1 Tax=Glossina brevipalpis TaxID=37001 RepID=A0A1A9W0M6_9MUSC
MSKVKYPKRCFICEAEACEEPELIRLHSFPKEINVKKKWCENLGIKLESLRPTTRICSRHFDHRLLGKVKLDRQAIPTLNLGPKGKLIHKMKAPVWSLDRCAVPTCEESALNRDIKFFKVPKGEDGKAWATCLGFDLIKKKMFVCQKHFAKDDIGQRRLRKGAFPCNSPSETNVSFEEVEYLDLSGSTVEKKFVTDEETETAMTIMPVTKTYGQKRPKEKGRVLEEFHDFSNLKEKIKRHNFEIIRCTGECLQKIAEAEKNYVIREIKLLKENDDLRERIRQLEQEKKDLLAEIILRS